MKQIHAADQPSVGTQADASRFSDRGGTAISRGTGVPPASFQKTEPGPAPAFTLIELLVVIGLIAAFAGGLGLALRGGNSSAALQSAQGTLGSLLSAVRAQAALTGGDAALLVNNNPGEPGRYLRYCVVVMRNTTTARWDPVNEGVYLPPGVYLLPPATPSGALSKPNLDWTRPSGGTLRSTAFSTSVVTQAVNATASESWIGVGFTPRGTVGAQGLGGNGDLVLATAEIRPPGANPPIQFNNPDSVRGLSLSNYGVAAPVDDRSGF